MSDWITDNEAEVELLDVVRDLRDRLEPTSDVRVDLSTMIAKLELRQAQRASCRRRDETDDHYKDDRRRWQEEPLRSVGNVSSAGRICLRMSVAAWSSTSSATIGCVREVYEAMAERLPEMSFQSDNVKYLLERFVDAGDVIRVRDTWRNRPRNLYYRRPMSPEIEDLNRRLEET